MSLLKCLMFRFGGETLADKGLLHTQVKPNSQTVPISSAPTQLGCPRDKM